MGDGHTRWQRFIRSIFKVLGPAQTGVPPFATSDEREVWRRANAPLPPARPSENLVPPGYQVKVYKDASGVEHRSLARQDEPGPAPDR